jgi:GDP-4-dehydro-6-deoxy-D-mannose reductase
MSRRVLITGGSGFVGQWLSRVMLQQGWSVFAGTVEGPPSDGVLSQPQVNAVHWIPLDVTSDTDIARAVGKSAPEYVVHLAAIASPPEANASPVRAFEVNSLGAVRLLHALASAKSANVRVLVIGSAEQYGAQDGVISETAPLCPLGTYASSKAAQEIIALQIFRSMRLQVICTRSFNHSGLGHGEHYLLPALVRRARTLPRAGGTLQIGNGSPIRDYLHVADVVHAYVLLLEKGAPGEVYNVCSGVGISVRELAERVLSRLGITADISTDPALVRPMDLPRLVGDNRKLQRATSWKPERSIDDVIDDLIHAASR